MQHFIATHAPQALETGIALLALLLLRYAARFAIRATVRISGSKAGETREVGRIVDLLLLLITGIILTGIWGVKQSELIIFATSVITVLGIGFFAEMSILSNVTAFLVLFFQHPVKVGDHIRLHDGDAEVEGELIEVSYFFAHVRTPAGTTVTVPNALLLKTSLAITHRGDE